MVYNSNDIQKIIPHRYPFLLVDQIDSIGEDGTSIVGHKCVSANEMQFLGHFPQQHLMPGVLIVEALAQNPQLLQLVTQAVTAQQAVQQMQSAQQVPTGQMGGNPTAAQFDMMGGGASAVPTV